MVTGPPPPPGVIVTVTGVLVPMARFVPAPGSVTPPTSSAVRLVQNKTVGKIIVYTVKVNLETAGVPTEGRSERYREGFVAVASGVGYCCLGSQSRNVSYAGKVLCTAGNRTQSIYTRKLPPRSL
jgi:hypothetical protein